MEQWPLGRAAEAAAYLEVKAQMEQDAIDKANKKTNIRPKGERRMGRRGPR